MAVNNSTSLWKTACLSLIALYVVGFSFNALTRTREFQDPDTMNFVDVARNITAGKGIHQSTLGFNQPVFGVNDTIPTPLTHQPPLYPLAIAGLGYAGLPATDAGVLISVVCYGFILLAAYAIAARLFGAPEALAAVLLLALFAPLRDFSQSAFSEPAGLALMFASFWLLAAYAGAAANRARLAALAGLAAGTAVGTRYALAPLVIVGAAFVFIEARQRIRDTALFLVAPAVTAILIVLRNINILNGSLLPHYLPSTTGYLKNIRGTAASLSSQYASESVPVLAQFILLLLVGLGLLALARKRGRLSTAAAVLIGGRGARLLTAFALFYMAFLIVQRSHSYIDAIGARYLLPASSVLVVLFAAFAVRASATDVRRLAIAGCLVMLAMIGWQVRTTLVTPKYDAQRLIEASDRLTWIQTHTSSADLIIGEDSADVSFYFRRPLTVSYSPFPYTETLPYPKLLGLCRRFKPDYSRILLVLRAHENSQKWSTRLGPFVYSAAAGQVASYPQIAPLAVLRDGRIYQVTC
jgi:hypothetical protein